MMPRFQDNRFPSEDPPYKDLWQRKWGSYTAVSYHHYRELRDEGRLPKNEMILLFREPGAMFFRPPAPALSISAVKTVFSVAPDSVGASVNNNNNNNNDNDPYIIVPKKAIRAAKQQVRAAREALRALDPYVRASAVSSSPAETKIKKKIGDDLKSASEPPSPKTNKHACRKCGDSSFRSRNALFDHIYSNTCKPSLKISLETPSSKSSNLQSSIITSNDTPVRDASSAADNELDRHRRALEAPAPCTPSAPASPGLLTLVKTRSNPGRGCESPIEWEFNHSPPVDSSPPFASTAVTPLSPRNRSVTSTIKHKKSSQLSSPGTPRQLPSTPNGSYSNKFDNFKQPSTLSTPHNCRTCNKSFASRNLLFAHLYDHNHCRPDKRTASKKILPSNVDKPFLLQNASWRTGKVTMDFGVLGDIIGKLTAVASAA